MPYNYDIMILWIYLGNGPCWNLKGQSPSLASWCSDIFCDSRIRERCSKAHRRMSRGWPQNYGRRTTSEPIEILFREPWNRLSSGIATIVRYFGPFSAPTRVYSYFLLIQWFFRKTNGVYPDFWYFIENNAISVLTSFCRVNFILHYFWGISTVEARFGRKIRHRKIFY